MFYLNKLDYYLKDDTKGAEIAIYVVSGGLFAFAYLRILPITKFANPKHIPPHFVRNRWQQHGVVRSIEPNSMLKIDHQPPLNFLLFNSKRELPVKMIGIQLNANGISWLDSVIKNRRVEFTPLLLHKDVAECRLLLNYSPKKTPLDLAEYLTRIGFAHVKKPSEYADKELQSYIAFLTRVQNQAKNQRVGEWSFSLPPPSLPSRMVRKLWSIITSLLPKKHRLPELIQ